MNRAPEPTMKRGAPPRSRAISLTAATAALAMLVTGSVAGSATATRHEGIATASAGASTVTVRLVARDIVDNGYEDAVIDVYVESDGASVEFSEPRVTIGPHGDSVRSYVPGAVDEDRYRLRLGGWRLGAGRHVLGVTGLATVTRSDGTTDQVQVNDTDVLTLEVLSEAALSVAVSPAAGRQGQPLLVHGYLMQWSYARGVQGKPGPVELWFDPAGSSPRSLVKTVTTDADGRFAVGVTAQQSGTWTAVHKGAGVATATASDSVSVSTPTLPSRTAVVGSGSDTRPRARVTVTDVVTGIAPTRIPIDVTMLQPVHPNDVGSATLRRDDGFISGSRLTNWDDTYLQATAWLDGADPAGRYDVSVSLYGQVWKETTSGDTNSITYDYWVPDATVLNVKRASTVGVAKSEKKVTGGKKVTLSGSVRRVGPVDGEPAWKPGAGVVVRVYYDPSGSSPKSLRATLRTRSTGRFTTTLKVGRSGTWTVEYAGSSSYAKSSTSLRTSV